MNIFPKTPELRRAAAVRLLALFLLLIVLPGGLIAYTISMPGTNWSEPPPPPTDIESARIPRLKNDVQALAVGIGPRNVFRPQQLLQTERFLVSRLRALQLSPSLQAVPIPGNDLLIHNVQVEFKGSAAPEEIILIGAHYDTVQDSPGADDNASGVAALLELARVLNSPNQRATLERTVRLVWFVNEEEPFFLKDEMGSRVYAKHAKALDASIKVAISLDMLGYYDTEQGTQWFPPIYKWKWDTRGNFVAFMGHINSRPHVQRVIGLFRESTRLPSMGIAVPLGFAGVERSDHWQFEQQGFPGLMITDTGPARNVHYHKPSDLPDTLDYPRLSRVVTGLIGVTTGLAKLSTPIP